MFGVYGAGLLYYHHHHIRLKNIGCRENFYAGQKTGYLLGITKEND